ncbi:MAG: WYL domain-containing protein [Phormidesmis sp.]
MGRITRIISFGSDEQGNAFDAIAQKLGFNRSSLIQAIADGEYAAVPLSEQTQSALIAAVVVLQNEASEHSAALMELLQKLPLTQPLKETLGNLDNRDALWVQQAKKLIAQRKAFKLAYHGKERLIRYAEVVNRDDREYLHCWVDEPSTDPDLPELAHNRLFFVGESAELTPSRAQWRDQGLDSVEVIFRVAFTYRPKGEDQQIQEVEAVSVKGQSWTRVTQRVTNLLWFLQRVARYGDRAVIESPESVRTIYKEQLEKALMLYDS